MKRVINLLLLVFAVIVCYSFLFPGAARFLLGILMYRDASAGAEIPLVLDLITFR